MTKKLALTPSTFKIVIFRKDEDIQNIKAELTLVEASNEEIRGTIQVNKDKVKILSFVVPKLLAWRCF